MRTLLLDAMTARVRRRWRTVRRCEQSLGEWAGHAEEAAVGARALVARLLQEEGVAGAIRAGVAHWEAQPGNKFEARTMLNRAFYDLEVLEGERCPELRSALEKGVVAHAQVNAECESVEDMREALKLFFDDGYKLHGSERWKRRWARPMSARDRRGRAWKTPSTTKERMPSRSCGRSGPSTRRRCS